MIDEDDEWQDVDILPDGSIVSPGGVVFRRRPERIRRAECRRLVAAGTPVITQVYPEGFRWYEREAASSVWSRISPRLLAGPKPLRIEDRWVAHAWESDTGGVILVFDGEH